MYRRFRIASVVLTKHHPLICNLLPNYLLARVRPKRGFRLQQRIRLRVIRDAMAELREAIEHEQQRAGIQGAFVFF